MGFRLESKPVATYDENHKVIEWKPHFPLGLENGKPIYVVNKKKSEIYMFLGFIKKHDLPIRKTHLFRIVVTGQHGDTAVIPVDL